VKKTHKKGKKAKVALKDLDVGKVKGSENPKGGFNPQPEPPALIQKGEISAVRTGFDPQPEPPGTGFLKGRIGSFNKH
jgi:hypothetical protein